MNATPPVMILCADDFGISDGVNAAILDLCAKGRLSAVSCMSLGPAWEKGSPLLKATGVAAGLHVTLTYLPPLVAALGARHPSEAAVILKSWARLLDRAALEREIRAQFQRFISVHGQPPAFIDGHQHVHALPVVRDIVLACREEFAPESWVRNVADAAAMGESWKNVVLFVLGFRFRGMLSRQGIPHNARFRGAYDLKDFGTAMEKWRGAPGLVYCHPGFPDAGLAAFDTLLEPRAKEHAFLSGEVFGGWLGRGLTLAGRP